MSTTIIAGAGHAGGQSAISLRQAGYEGRIIVCGAEPVPPYQRPPLSKKYLSGELALARVFLPPGKLLVQERHRAPARKPGSGHRSGTPGGRARRRRVARVHGPRHGDREPSAPTPRPGGESRQHLLSEIPGRRRRNQRRTRAGTQAGRRGGRVHRPGNRLDGERTGTGGLRHRGRGPDSRTGDRARDVRLLHASAPRPRHRRQAVDRAHLVRGATGPFGASSAAPKPFPPTWS